MTTTEEKPAGPAKAVPAWHLLRERMFRRYWGAAAISFVGDQITLLALPLLAAAQLRRSVAPAVMHSC